MLQTAALNHWGFCTEYLVITDWMWSLTECDPLDSNVQHQIGMQEQQSPLDDWIKSACNAKDIRKVHAGRHAKQFFYMLLLNIGQSFFPESPQPTARWPAKWKLQLQDATGRKQVANMNKRQRQLELKLMGKQLTLKHSKSGHCETSKYFFSFGKKKKLHEKF